MVPLLHFQPQPPSLASACGRILDQPALTTDLKRVTCRQCRKSCAFRRRDAAIALAQDATGTTGDPEIDGDCSP